MITGNFALPADCDPDEVVAWNLGINSDAFQAYDRHRTKRPQQASPLRASLRHQAARPAHGGDVDCGQKAQAICTSIRFGWACSALGMRNVSTPCSNLASTLLGSSSRDSVNTRR